MIFDSQVAEYILLYGKGVLLRQLKEDRTFPREWPLHDKNNSSKGMKVLFLKACLMLFQISPQLSPLSRSAG